MNARCALYMLAGAFLTVVAERARAALGVEPERRPRESVEAMLQSFVEDFRTDPCAGRPITFGIRVVDAEPAEWHVFVGGKEEEGEAEAVVELAEGLPFDPAPCFVTDMATLTAIHAGELASLTAMGKALSTDFAPLDLESMEGFVSSEEIDAHLTRLSFHFWTRGFPELIRFGEGASTRELHGGNGVLLYYQPGFRSGWFRIEAGQHVNETEVLQSNPFPSLVIATRGELHCRIGGKELTLEQNVAVWIGPGVTHEFWVEEGEEPGEGFLFMFGEGA